MYICDIDTDNSMVITRGGGGGGGNGQSGEKGDGKRPVGGERTVPPARDVLVSCALETCVVLLTNVTPVNSIKNK